MRRTIWCVTLLVLAAAQAAGCDPVPPPVEAVQQAQHSRGKHHRRRHCDPVARGEAAFRDGDLDLEGNGRACADCHEPQDSFQLSPASVEARYQAMLENEEDDPLFRPLDADDFEINGEEASDFRNLRENGLVRIRLPLPANIKLVDPDSCRTGGLPAPCQTAETYAVSDRPYTDVWRAVPSVIDVALTGPDAEPSIWPRGPNPQGGYQLDARLGSLTEQARAAFINHAQVAVEPEPQLLEDLAAFERSLVHEPEPALDALETEGKAIFDRACGQCHNGPGKSSPLTQTPPIIRYHDISSACLPPLDAVSPPRWSLPPCPPSLARNARTYEITFADGFKMRRTSSDPGRALLSGFVFSAGLPPPGGACLRPPCGAPPGDDWQKLDVPSLRGIGKTAPYFHNNSAATLDEVVIHYEEFFKRASALNPPPAMPAILTTDGVNRDRPNLPSERAALVAYLRRL